MGLALELTVAAAVGARAWGRPRLLLPLSDRPTPFLVSVCCYIVISFSAALFSRSKLRLRCPPADRDCESGPFGHYLHFVTSGPLRLRLAAAEAPDCGGSPQDKVLHVKAGTRKMLSERIGDKLRHLNESAPSDSFLDWQELLVLARETSCQLNSIESGYQVYG